MLSAVNSSFLTIVCLTLLTACADFEKIQAVKEPCTELLASLPAKVEKGDIDPRASETGEVTLVTYQVSGDSIIPQDLPLIPDDLASLQENATLQAGVWDLITDLLPAQIRTNLTRYVLFTDGSGRILGGITRITGTEDWQIELDLLDASDLPTLTVTLLHETAHLLTLDESQIIRGNTECNTFALPDACLTPDSYLNLFVESFWSDLLEEWSALSLASEGTLRTDQVFDFYNHHPGEFISRYAAASPQEDIAESFLHFILSPAPTGPTQAEEKVLFFYNYPTLAGLRDAMRQTLCEHFLP